MDQHKPKWKIVERPGWFGEDRDVRIRSYDEKYGSGNWRIRHILGPRIMDFKEAVMLYEISYELHFLNPHTRYLWINLFKMASDVWTEDISDISSGTDYSVQRAKASHYEDMAVRCIMQKYGFKFKGERLIRIRADSQDVVGVALSSIHIPFVFPEFIEVPQPEILWWNRHKRSLEEFWHYNKVLQIRDDCLL